MSAEKLMSAEKGCPSSEELAAFLERAFDDGHWFEIARHLDDCATCYALLEECAQARGETAQDE